VPTSDGITDYDWQRVHEIALRIANDDDREDVSRAALLSLLDELEETYGPLPSLLATRADYVESTEDREGLLHVAFAEAERLGDSRNMQLVAHSLVEYYAEETLDLGQGECWFQQWRTLCSGRSEDSAEESRLESLLGGPAT
jgi:hypothetical protein